jgi:drug/metabolite transporter (DMT)-like permease
LQGHLDYQSGENGQFVPIAPIVLSAAALHASWNALVKSVTDRLALMAVMGGATVVICLPMILLSRSPSGRAWPELGTSIVLHTIYNLLLLEAYSDGDFNQVYPVARGTAPPTVAVASVIVVGEGLSAIQVLGVLAVSAGLVMLASGRPHGSRRALTFAVVTGLFIAAYTVVDGVGVRHSGSVLGYTGCLLAIEGALTAVILVAIRSRRSETPRRIGADLVPRGILAGGLSIAAYALVLWAQTRGALAVVAALRETSVVFAAVIGAVMFHEHLPSRRIVASAVVAAGAAALALG